MRHKNRSIEIQLKSELSNTSIITSIPKKVLQGTKNLNETASIYEYNKLWHSSEFLHENIRYEFQMKIHTVVEQRN